MGAFDRLVQGRLHREVCTNQACTEVSEAETWETQYYENSQVIEHAKPVAVTEHATSGSINAALAEAPPIKVEPPRLTGTAAVGGTLTCSPGAWANATRLEYTWLRNGTPISGPTSPTYIVQPADAGSLISCRVTAYNRAGGAESATSNLVRIALVATVATTGSTTAAPGTAGLSGSPSLKAGSSTFTLQCTGTGPCSGTVKLLAKVTEKRTVKRHGSGHRQGHAQHTVGETGYSIAIGGTTTLTIHLSAKGRSLLRSAGTKGLKVTLSGAGVQSSTVVLKEKPKHGKKK